MACLLCCLVEQFASFFAISKDLKVITFKAIYDTTTHFNEECIQAIATNNPIIHLLKFILCSNSNMTNLVLRCTTLKKLRIVHSNVTIEDLVHICLTHPSLICFDFGKDHKMTNVHIKQMLDTKHMQTLYLTECENVQMDEIKKYCAENNISVKVPEASMATSRWRMDI